MLTLLLEALAVVVLMRSRVELEVVPKVALPMERASTPMKRLWNNILRRTCIMVAMDRMMETLTPSMDMVMTVDMVTMSMTGMETTEY